MSGTTLDGSCIASVDPSMFDTTFFKLNKEVVRIAHDGRIYWNGREIESDDDFRAAMRDLAAVLSGRAAIRERNK